MFILNYPGMPGYNPALPLITPEMILPQDLPLIPSGPTPEEEAQRRMAELARQAQIDETNKAAEERANREAMERATAEAADINRQQREKEVADKAAADKAAADKAAADKAAADNNAEAGRIMEALARQAQIDETNKAIENTSKAASNASEEIQTSDISLAERIAADNAKRTKNATEQGGQAPSAEQYNQDNVKKIQDSGVNINDADVSIASDGRYFVKTEAGKAYMTADQLAEAGYDIPVPLARKMEIVHIGITGGSYQQGIQEQKWAVEDALQEIADTYNVPVEDLYQLADIVKNDPDNPGLRVPQEYITLLPLIANATSALTSNVQRIINNRYIQVGTDLSPNQMQALSISNYAKEHGISITETMELMDAARENPKSEKLKGLSEEGIASLLSPEMQEGRQFVLKADFEDISAQSPNLADELKHKGLATVNITIKGINERASADEEIRQKSLQEFEDYLDSDEAPEGAKEAYKKGGISGYEKFIDKYIQDNELKAKQQLNDLMFELPSEYANRAENIRHTSGVNTALAYIYSERDKILREFIEKGYTEQEEKTLKPRDNEAIKRAIKGIKTGDTTLSIQYDIVKALKDGYDENKIAVAFGKAATNRAKETIRIVNITHENNDSIPDALLNKDITMADIGLAFGDDMGKKAGEWLDNVNSSVKHLNGISGWKYDPTFEIYHSYDEAKDGESYKQYVKSGGKVSQGKWAEIGRPKNKLSEPDYIIGDTTPEQINLGSAIRQAGLYGKYKDKTSSISEMWGKYLTDDERTKVASIYNTFVNPKNDIQALATAMETALNDSRMEKPSDIYKLPGSLVFGMVSAITTPFAKNSYYDEMGKQLISKYSVKVKAPVKETPLTTSDTSTGEIEPVEYEDKLAGFDITAYLKDYPFDSEKLIRGGFDVEDIKRAQNGEKIRALPAKATPLDWITAGLTAGTLFTGMVASPILQLGLLGTTSGVFGYQYVKGLKDMSWTERIVYGTMLALPFAKAAKGAVVYGFEKGLNVATGTLGPESIRTKAGMPHVEVKPGLSEPGFLDAVRIAQESAQSAKWDILASDSKGNYIHRVTPLERINNILRGKDTYEFSSRGTDDYFLDAIKKAKPGQKPYLESGISQKTLDWDYASQGAWIERGAEMFGKAVEDGYTPKLIIEGRINSKSVGFSTWQDVFNKLMKVGEPEMAKDLKNAVRLNDNTGLEAVMRAANDKLYLANMRFPLRQWFQNQGQTRYTGLIGEPESRYGSGTRKYIVGLGAVRSPKNFYVQLRENPALEVKKPAEWSTWSKGKQESWYRKQGALSPARAKELETLRPAKWDDMLPEEQAQWNYDNHAAIKAVGKGHIIPIRWTSLDPNAQPPNYITRVVAEVGAEPYTRLKRLLSLAFDPNTKRVTNSGYGVEASLPGLNRIVAKARNEGQIHVGTYDNEYFNVKTNSKSDGTGFVVFGDFHGKYGDFKNLVNWAFDKNILSGREGNLRLNANREHIILCGDISDRGPYTIKLWNDMLSLNEQTSRTPGAKVDVLMGNHDLAHLTKEHIEGIKYDNAKYEKKLAKIIRDGVISGKIKAAALTDDGGIATHAGLSLEKFPEYVGKSPDFIVADLNSRLFNAVKNNKYTDPIFDIGRLDGGKGVGGIFWYRPGESITEFTKLPYKQYAGHTPTVTRGGKSWSVTDRGGITYVDTARWWDNPNVDRVMNFYADTPTTKAVKTGELLARPGEGETITFKLPKETVREVSEVISNVDKYMGDDVKMYSPDDTGLTIKIPDGLTPEQRQSFISDVSSILKTSNGKLTLGKVSGYPNNYSPAYMYLGLKDDVSLSQLVNLQKRIDAVGSKMGYKQGDFKVQAGLTLGEVTGNRTVARRMVDVMRRQKDSIETRLNRYRGTDGIIKKPDAKLNERLNRGRVIDDNLNLVQRLDEDYPPTIPDDYDMFNNGSEGQLSIGRGRIPFSYVSTNEEQAISSAEIRDAAVDAYNYYPVSTDEEIAKLAEEETGSTKTAITDIDTADVSTLPDYADMEVTGSGEIEKTPAIQEEKTKGGNGKSVEEFINDALAADGRGEKIKADRLFDKAEEKLSEDKSKASGKEKSKEKAKKNKEKLGRNEAMKMLGNQRLMKPITYEDIVKLKDKKGYEDLDEVELARLVVKSRRYLKEVQLEEQRGRAGERVAVDYQPRAERSLPEELAAEMFGTEKMAQETINPEKPIVERVAPEREITEKVGQEKTLPEETLVEKIQPEKITPEKISYPPEGEPLPEPPPYGTIPYTPPPPPYGTIPYTPPPPPPVVITPPPGERFGNKGKTDKEKREIIKGAFAAVAYVRGKLLDQEKHKKLSVWHAFVKVNEKSDWERLIVRGARPDGARYASGPKSARVSMQRIAGNAKIDIFEDTGAVDTRIIGDTDKKTPDIMFVQDKDAKKKKTSANDRIRNKGFKDVKLREPKVVELGAGIVREGRRQHLK